MNRGIKFRGKRILSGSWTYGQYTWGEQGGKVKHFISESPWSIQCEVLPQTVGQYTDYFDDNDLEVCEGDVIEVEYGKGRVVYACSAFMISWIDDPEANMELLSRTSKNRTRNSLKIIGNIHEPPHLINR